MIWSALLTSWLASAKLNVWAKQIVSSSQVVISLCSSADMYHDLGISSKVWIKAWTHSSFGHDSHKVWLSIRWPLESFHTSCFPMWYTSMSPKWTIINRTHCAHPVIFFLWVTHQHGRVAFSASSSTNNHCGFDTFSSKSFKKVDNLGILLWVGNSTIAATKWHSDYVFKPYFLSDTSCMLFCHFYNAPS